MTHSSDGAKTAPTLRRGRLSAWIVALWPLLAVIILAAVVRLVAGPAAIAQLRDGALAMGPAGAILFGLAFAGLTAIVVSGTLLTLAAGAVFGLWGVPVALLGATLGAALGFLAARFLFRGRVSAVVHARPRLAALDRAIGEDGWRICLLLRLSPPVPFSPLNWVLGASALRFWPYLGATALGIIPGTCLFVWVGAAGAAAASDVELSRATVGAFLALGLVCVILAFFVTRRASRRLRELTAAARD